MMRSTTVVVVLLLCATAVSAQRRAFDLTTPRPIAAADKVWIEELTTIANGKNLVEIRANITVEVIKKALVAK